MRFLIDRLEQQYRFQDRLLVIGQGKLPLAQPVRVEDRSDRRLQIHSPDIAAMLVRPALIKKVPQIINRQKVAVLGTLLRDEILERLNVRVAVLDEIENAALVGRKISRKVLQQDRGDRMDRQNVGQNFFVAYLDEVHDDFARLCGSLLERGGNLTPFVCGDGLNLQRMTDQLERNVVGHRDVHVLKSVAHDAERLIALARQTVRLMRRDHQIERRDIRQLRQPLKLVEIVSVVPEELGELVPEQHDRLQFILLNDLGDPIDQVPHVDVERPNAFPLAQPQNLFDELRHLRLRIFQPLDDLFRRSTCQRRRQSVFGLLDFGAEHV